MIRKCLLLSSVLIVVHSVIGQASQDIDSLLRGYSEPNSPGFSVAVIHDGEYIYAKGFGRANLDYSIDNTDSSRFDIASVAKQFTAAAIWALEEQGELSLEDPINSYLPEFPDYERPVRIRHLLNHTSGIRSYHTLMHLSGFNYTLDYYDLTDILELACRQNKLNNVPGEVVAYSNTNYSLLTLIVEKVSGLDLNSFLEQYIFHPLEMMETEFRTSLGKTLPNKSVGYYPTPSGFAYDPDNQLSYGAGSAYSSVNDMCEWMHMLNGENSEFISLANFLKTTEQLPNGKMAKYARGVMIDSYKGFEVVSHSGMGTGNRSQMIVVPEKKTGVIVLTNLGSIDASDMAYKVLDLLLPEVLKTLPDSSPKVYNMQLDLAQFEGEFRENNSDMTMKVFVENDSLKALGAFGRSAYPLIPSEHFIFYRLDSENVKFDFNQEPNYDLVISFGGNPFYFSRIELVPQDFIDLSIYEGEYFSNELEVTYSFKLRGENLVLSYPGNENVRLHSLQKDEFGNHDRTLFVFTKDDQNRVNGMNLSCDGNVQNIPFRKIEPSQ